MNPQPTTAARVLALLRQRGYTLDALPYDAWRERIQRTENSRLLPLLPLFTDDLPVVLRGAPVFDTAETTRGLAGSGVTCPPADEALLERYITYLIESKRWPAPTRTPQQVNARHG